MEGGREKMGVGYGREGMGVGYGRGTVTVNNIK